MREAVVDANVIVQAVLGQRSLNVAIDTAHAPELSLLECVNGLRRMERAGLIPASVVDRAATDIVTIVEIRRLTADDLRQTLLLSRQLDHSAYDCAYLAVALALGLPLLTLDEKFRRKACAAGYGAHLPSNWSAPSPQ